MRIEAGSDLEVVPAGPPEGAGGRPPVGNRSPFGSGPGWRRNAGWLVAIGVFLAGVGLGRAATAASRTPRTCVVMRFGDAVTYPQIVSIFDAAEGGSAVALAEQDGHRASLLFATRSSAANARDAAERVAAPQIGHTASIRLRPWSECLEPQAPAP